MNYQQEQLFATARVLFIKDGCPFCRIWKKFIESINLELPLRKRFKIVDCTKFEMFKITNDPLIKIFNNSFDGYPTLFFEGRSIAGAHTIEEADAFVRALVHEDFIITPYNEFLFDKECRFIEKGIIFKKRSLYCEN